jgi:hypothetical protein
MAKTQRLPTNVTGVTSTAWTGWIVFASLMLAVVGAVNIVQGLVALTQDDYFLVRNGDQLLLLDFQAWGWVLLIWGLAQVGAGIGLNFGHGWARVRAIFVACVSVLIQTLFLSAYPIWSAIIITLDVIVIYALTARWSEARAGLE